jgi:hypothetical protein
MDDVHQLLDERVCEALIIEYVRFVDFGEASRLADLFTPDGVWEAGDVVLEGQDAIRSHYARREAVVRRVSRHYCTNVAIEVLSENEARGLAYFLNFRHDRAEGDLSLPVPAGLPKYSGEYHCRFVRTPNGWRFALLHVDVTFLRPPNAPPEVTK